MPNPTPFTSLKDHTQAVDVTVSTVSTKIASAIVGANQRITIYNRQSSGGAVRISLGAAAIATKGEIVEIGQNLAIETHLDVYAIRDSLSSVDALLSVNAYQL